jgi:membrane fusion protein (multidrug efflux system)
LLQKAVCTILIVKYLSKILSIVMRFDFLLPFVGICAITVAGCGNSKKNLSENIIHVKTITVDSASFSGGRSYPGTIEEGSGTSLSFASMGTVKAIYVSEGQNVRAGQLIGMLDSTTTSNSLALAKAATNQARAAYDQAEDAYKRMQRLHESKVITEIQWVEVQTKYNQAKQLLVQAQSTENIARKGLRDTRLSAPFSGYISKKIVDAGQNVTPGMPVVKLVDINKVKVSISVPEDDLASISEGQRVRFSVNSLGDKTFTGIISEIGVSADLISRQYDVKALVDNPDHALLPGMVCDVFMESSSNDSSLCLPANVIQIDIDNKPFVWTVRDGKALKTYVKIGENVGENITIEDGLQSGDEVIVEGQHKVSNGTKIMVD